MLLNTIAAGVGSVVYRVADSNAGVVVAGAVAGVGVLCCSTYR